MLDQVEEDASDLENGSCFDYKSIKKKVNNSANYLKTEESICEIANYDFSSSNSNISDRSYNLPQGRSQINSSLSHTQPR